MVIQPARKEYNDIFACLMSEYHYLGYKGVVGENMKYLFLDNSGRYLGCMLFGSSAWKSQCRDTFIGWNEKVRLLNLNYTTNNMRFLILPWIRVPHLASHILGMISRRIYSDWLEKYGHPIYMLETFVEKDRFKGTCYKAANWQCVGVTKGRSRNDRHTNLKVPVKEVFIYPLTSNYREKLRGRID